MREKVHWIVITTLSVICVITATAFFVVRSQQIALENRLIECENRLEREVNEKAELRRRHLESQERIVNLLSKEFK